MGVAILVIVGSTAALAATVPSIRVALGAFGAISSGPAAQYVIRVDGPSMESTYHDGQYVQLQPLTAGRPHRCDVIAFHPPTSPQVVYLKRVVGLPGDHISFTSTGVIGDASQCDRYAQALQSGQLPGYDPSLKLTLGGQDYYVLGDNRANSADSRAFGLVPLQNIVGFIAAP